MTENELFTEIEEARAFAQATIDTVREPFLVLDQDLRVLAASRAFCHTFKVSQGDTQGRLLYALGDGQWDIPSLRLLLEKIVPERGEMKDYEVEHEFPGIGQRTMLLNARKVFYEGGSHTTILLGIEDVTVQRVLEREKDELLRQFEEARAFAQAIVDTVREPFLVLDQDLRVLAASRSFCHTFKVSHDDTQGRLLYTLGDGQWDIPSLRLLLEKIVPERGEMADYEVEHEFPGIGQRTMLLNARKVFYEGGSHTTILLGIEDITAQRVLEREKDELLRQFEEARAFAQAIVDTVREPFLVLDQDLRVLAASRSFCQTFKVSHDETQGRLLYALGHGQWDIPKLHLLLEKIVPEQGVMEDYEVEHEFPDIGQRTMCLNARKVFYEGGSHTTILLGIEDITAQRVLEREKDELLRQQSGLIEQKAMLAREFDHRLMNSLQLISSLLSLQSRTTKNPEAAAQLAIAGNRVAALGRVHRRLHVLDHLETVEFKQYASRLCEDLSGMLHHEEAQRAIVVEGDDIEIPTLLGIPLGFIVNELVTNSTKYAKGKITVRLDSTPAGYSLSVFDDGAGLPEGFTLSGHKGLGMKIIQSLVKQIGGELQFGRGDDDRGARFTILFSIKPPSELLVNGARIDGGNGNGNGAGIVAGSSVAQPVRFAG